MVQFMEQEKLHLLTYTVVITKGPFIAETLFLMVVCPGLCVCGK